MTKAEYISIYQEMRTLHYAIMHGILLLQVKNYVASCIMFYFIFNCIIMLQNVDTFVPLFTAKVNIN